MVVFDTWPVSDIKNWTPGGLCQGYELTFAAHRAGIHWRTCCHRSHRQARAGGGRPAAQPCLHTPAGKEKPQHTFQCQQHPSLLPAAPRQEQVSLVAWFPLPWTGQDMHAEHDSSQERSPHPSEGLRTWTFRQV